MSVAAIKWAKKQEASGPTARLVLILLAEHADAAGRCWPSLTTLADESMANRRTVVRVIAELEERGLVARHRRQRDNGSAASTEYELLTSKEREVGASRPQGGRGTTPLGRGVTPPPLGAQDPQVGASRPYTVGASRPPLNPQGTTSKNHQAAHARTREDTKPDPWSPAASGPHAATAYRLVDDAIGSEHPSSVRTALAVEATALLNDQRPSDLVDAALRLWLRKPHLGPKALSSLASEVLRQPSASNGTGTGPATDKATGWLALVHPPPDDPGGPEPPALPGAPT